MHTTAVTNTAAHSLSSVVWSIIAAVVVSLVYIGLMSYRHHRWAATGAVGRLFIEVWFLTGIAIFTVKLIRGESVTDAHEDYAFLVLGLGLAALICVKHVARRFSSVFKPKPSGWEPSTENADE